MAQLHLDENTVLETIARVINENRKVIKTGNTTTSTPPVDATPQMPPMMPPIDNMGGQGIPPSQDTEDINNGMPDMGMAQNGENQFDSNFDAGVEADEDTDPKHYIQQLTGKLSQKIGSFNEEQGGDAGLNKYVASMIIKATCKYLDDNAKKDLIEKINTSENSDTEMPEDGNMEKPEMNGDNIDIEQQPSDDTQLSPMNESVYTKKSFMLNERFFTVGELRARYKKELKENPNISINDILSNNSKRPQETKEIKCPKSWTSKFN